MVVLDDHLKLNETWRKCRKLVKHTERTESIWFDNLVKLRANKKNYIAKSKIKSFRDLATMSFRKIIFKIISLHESKKDTILKFIRELTTIEF